MSRSGRLGKRSLGWRFTGISSPGPTSRTLRCERLESRVLLHGGDLLIAEAEGSDGPVPDFELLDVNPDSDTFDQNVSPRDYLQQASGWYFGYAST
jgi:hypothetical protein